MNFSTVFSFIFGRNYREFSISLHHKNISAFNCCSSFTKLSSNKFRSSSVMPGVLICSRLLKIMSRWDCLNFFIDWWMTLNATSLKLKSSLMNCYQRQRNLADGRVSRVNAKNYWLRAITYWCAFDRKISSSKSCCSTQSINVCLSL